MKIKINERESYLIDLPEEIDGEEFLGMLRRLRELKNLLSLSAPVTVLNQRAKRTNWTRELAIKNLRIKYLGTREEKLALAESRNSDWRVYTKTLDGQRKRYGITAQEVGLIRFPKKGEGIGKAMESLKIKNQQEVSQDDSNSDVSGQTDYFRKV